MNRFNSYSKRLIWSIPVLLAAFIAGCGGGSGSGGRDPILGVGAIAVLPPSVTAVAPINNATNVPINNTIISAAFSEPMAPITGGASFTVTCGAPCTSPSGTVTLDATNRIATYSTGAVALQPLTLYTATVTGARSLATGLSLPAPYVWRFTTGVVPDTTRPFVILTVPATTSPGPTTGAATNTAITAVFSEDMAPGSITAATFTLTCALPCVSPAGSVNYSVGSRTASFTPAAVLVAGTTYTATVTSGATDLAGNALAGNQAPLPAASNYVWQFTTASPIPPAIITVGSTNPSAGAVGVCPNVTVSATFNVPSGLRMDPLTVTTGTFTITGPGPASASTPVVAASVILDSATGRIATFTPAAPLATNTYTATIKGGALGVKDTAIPANSMVSDYVWMFTVANPCVVIPPVPPGPAGIDLGTASTYGIMSTSAITNTGPSIINGDVALSPGTSQGIPPAQVNGTIHVNDAAAAAAKADLLKAYNFAKALPPGVGPNSLAGGANLSGLTLPPGTYTSPSTILISGPADLTLDAGGNPNALWVFQIGSSLTTVTGNVKLSGGALAKNVFWVPTADATLGTNTIFYGTILAGRDVTSNTGAKINGRILAGAIGAATVALQSTSVTVPGP